jgi:hypothetical protein
MKELFYFSFADLMVRIEYHQKITLAEIIPAELRSYFGLPAEAGYSRTARIVHASFGA